MNSVESQARTDIDALAKSLGAKIVGRLDKAGLYRCNLATRRRRMRAW